jgi:hypothetical protein
LKKSVSEKQFSQCDFADHPFLAQVIPDESRWYRFRTTGSSDTVMVLFEDDGKGNERQIAADDDSGYERNAEISLPLERGVRYVLRVRLYYKDKAATFGVVYEGV